CAVFLSLLCGPDAARGQETAAAEQKDEPVSFYRQIRPVLQRNCSGCHQPSKRGGKLLLTSYEDFRKGGENGEAFAAGKPDESLILDYISGDEPAMPQNADPLPAEQVELIARWIREGAKDDTPAGLQDNVSAANPPKYA